MGCATYLMNSAESLKDEKSRVFHKVIGTINKEEIVGQNSFTFTKLLLSLVKIKVHVEALNELGDWVLISIRLLLNDTNNFFQGL